MTRKMTPEQLEQAKITAHARRLLNPPKRPRKDCKYDPKFAEQLLSGMRYKKKMTKAHLCMKWKVTPTTIDNWVEKYPDFARAYEIATQHYAAYLLDKLHDSLEGEKVNAASLNFALTNVLGWSTKSENTQKNVDTFGTITIEVIDAQLEHHAQEPLLIEHNQDDDNIVDGEIIDNKNVVPINGSEKS